MRFSAEGSTGLAALEARLSAEASTALKAMWASHWGGLALALVGRKPKRAAPKPPRMRTAKVTITPRRKLRMKASQIGFRPLLLIGDPRSAAGKRVNQVRLMLPRLSS